MKWAADWWGIELIAETAIEACLLKTFTDVLTKEAVSSYLAYRDINEFEIEHKSHILGKEFPMVVILHRGD